MFTYEPMGLPLRSLTGIVYADDLPTRVIHSGQLRCKKGRNVQLRGFFGACPTKTGSRHRP